MTHTAVHSEFVSMGFNRKRRVSFPHDIYQVVVNGEEGEYAEYEVENEFNVTDTLYFTAQTKRKVSFDRSFAVCCGQSSAYDDNTEIEYESETSSLSYSFARHLTQALQSHKLYLISPELPVGSSILITDIESELSDATNANNHVKFKWKPLRKQVPFTVPRLHNIFNQVYNNTFNYCPTLFISPRSNVCSNLLNQ